GQQAVPRLAVVEGVGPRQRRHVLDQGGAARAGGRDDHLVGAAGVEVVELHGAVAAAVPQCRDLTQVGAGGGVARHRQGDDATRVGELERLRSGGEVDGGHDTRDVERRRRLDRRQPQGVVEHGVWIGVLVEVGDDVAPRERPQLPEGHGSSIARAGALGRSAPARGVLEQALTQGKDRVSNSPCTYTSTDSFGSEPPASSMAETVTAYSPWWFSNVT